MPSSSAYAAPIDLDLRPGRWERGGRVVAGFVALGALALADLPLLMQFLGASLAVLVLARDAAKAARRPTRMLMYADGNVECSVPCRSALARDPQASRASALLQNREEPSRASALLQNREEPSRASALLQNREEPSRASALLHDDDGLMEPATLLQATSFLGLTQLRWADAVDAYHACLLFPDRTDTETRHRLRVWLATHRPSRAPFPVPRAPGAPESAPT